MAEKEKSKHFDLEDRTQAFAKQSIKYIHSLPKTLTNIEIAKQLVRAAVQWVPITSKRMSLWGEKIS